MFILNVIDNGLGCDFGVIIVLIMTYINNRLCKKYFLYILAVLIVYYICYIAFTESIYFLCFKKTKTIEHIYRYMCLLMCKLIVLAYLIVPNILFL